MIIDNYRYVFSNIISHINTVCFTFKSHFNRLNIITRYIFNSLATLFSEDISENSIILSTFADKEAIKYGPCFINDDDDFLNNIKRGKDDKWWFAIDSQCVLDSDEN